MAVCALLALAVCPAASARAGQQGQGGLEAPLAMANMCGPGTLGEVQFTLAATGDTFPHENIQAVGEAQSYGVLFDQVRPFLQAADLAYTNFDGAMLEGTGYTGYPMFNYNPALAAALRDAGVDLVSTANNHILDRGPEGIDATLKVLAANGIQQHGTVPSAEASAAHPPYLRLPVAHDGVTITLGFVSATWGTNGNPDPQGQVNLLYGSSDYGQQGGVRQPILDAVAQARRETDLVVVAAHWGHEYQFTPDQSQLDAARLLAEAGADVILGAQSHTLQPVDILEHNGRQTLVIYSLANFLASQGAYQDEFYSATSVIFYVGLVRSPDGGVRVSGYRYLPTIHVENDTRPAPIPQEGYEQVVAHVRQMMRDPHGLRQVPPDAAALPQQLPICQELRPAQGAQPVGGDFAQLYRTLGGDAPVALSDAVTALGLPTDPAAPALGGDCATTLPVLTTPTQRLEYHADAPWPYRVVGTQLGAAVYQRRYRPAELVRGDVSDITNATFQSFYQRYGGTPIFGLPISGELDEGGTNVQYFERARFELNAGAAATAPLGQQVRLGRLSEEYGGIEAMCGLPAPTAAPVATAVPVVVTAAAPVPAAPVPLAAWVALALLASVALGFGGGWLVFRSTMPAGVAPGARSRSLRGQQASGGFTYYSEPAGQGEPPPAAPADLLRDLLGLPPTPVWQEDDDDGDLLTPADEDDLRELRVDLSATHTDEDVLRHLLGV